MLYITEIIDDTFAVKGRDDLVIWHEADDYPKEHKDITVRDKNGKEYDNHYWVGHAYYSYVEDGKGGCDGWRSDVDIINWKYR